MTGISHRVGQTLHETCTLKSNQSDHITLTKRARKGKKISWSLKKRKKTLKLQLK